MLTFKLFPATARLELTYDVKNRLTSLLSIKQCPKETNKDSGHTPHFTVMEDKNYLTTFFVVLLTSLALIYIYSTFVAKMITIQKSMHRSDIIFIYFRK